MMMSCEFIVLWRSGKARARMARDNRNAIENIYKSSKVHTVDARNNTKSTTPVTTPASEDTTSTVQELKPLDKSE